MALHKVLLVLSLAYISKDYTVSCQCFGSGSNAPAILPQKGSSGQPSGQFIIPAVIKPLIGPDTCIPYTSPVYPNVPQVPRFSGGSVDDGDDDYRMLYNLILALSTKGSGSNTGFGTGTGFGFGNIGGNGCGNGFGNVGGNGFGGGFGTIGGGGGFGNIGGSGFGNTCGAGSGSGFGGGFGNIGGNALGGGFGYIGGSGFGGGFGNIGGNECASGFGNIGGTGFGGGFGTIGGTGSGFAGGFSGGCSCMNSANTLNNISGYDNNSGCCSCGSGISSGNIGCGSCSMGGNVSPTLEPPLLPVSAPVVGDDISILQTPGQPINIYFRTGDCGPCI